MRTGLSGLFRGMLPGVAIDLGTVNTLIAVRGRGIVLKEPSAIAVSTRNERDILAVGRAALTMLGRTPGGIRVLYPMRDGVVADHAMCEAMLRFYIKKVLGKRAPWGAELMLCLPMCVTSVERKALQDAARCTGINEARFMEEPLAAALGAQLPVEEPIGSMIVDIGGGTTDVAVVSLGGIAASCSIRTGGIHIDEAIMEYVDKAHGLVIGRRTAEDVKRTIGAMSLHDGACMQIRGRKRESGLPVSLTVGAGEIGHAILPVVRQILDAVRRTLADTPPELAGDVGAQGIVLCGGGAQLKGLDQLVTAETGVATYVAADPMDCVVMGAMRALAGYGSPVAQEDFGTVETG
ncbi:MAG: rod shape-determining protein [Clostridia bacterium]|nr:rod shape-determining protein [Clostridia bacterium]